ncbi:SIS domain-containing protein [Pseudarthrobacter sp. P1]|uniref:SIS domain-containing protein n=1 Tax=Pseudarthrobacter sp. P1 TaxID=3418418 RepID=UPI003CF9C1AA
MTQFLGLSPVQLKDRGAEATAREIGQQPAVWRETAQIVAGARAELDAFLTPLLERDNLRIVLTGAGTSAFAGDILAPSLARRLGRRVEAVATTDIVSNPHDFFAEDVPTLLVSFARSGNSPESVAATEIADQLLAESYHLVLTCAPEGKLYLRHAGAENSFALLMPAAANDQGFAMTSSVTSMVLSAWLVLGAAGSTELGKQLAAAAEGILASRQDAILDLAKGGFERIVYLGSGPLRGLAQESALKLLELTAGTVVTYFDSSLGFRHGPKAVLDPTTLVVLYISSDAGTRAYDLDILAELRQSLPAGNVLAITATPEVAAELDGVWLVDGLDGVEDAALALPYVLIAQLFALSYSLELGKTPDNPFPDASVNRVVQGVTIHPLAAAAQL